MIDLILSFIPGGSLTAIIAGAGALLLAFWRTYAAGKKAKENERAAERLRAMNEADEIERSVTDNDPDANRKELRRWSR